jgi:hypothetical protein
MKQEAATVAACGGKVGYWTYPLGNGALVPSRIKKAIAVREFLREREDLFLHTESASWAAILASDPSCPTFGDGSIEGAHKALAALHCPPDVMDETGVVPDMRYDLIVLPEQDFINPSTAGKLAEFVRQGGKLLTSGNSIHSPELQELLGVKAVHRAKLNDGHVLLKTSDEPAGIDSAWDMLGLDGAEELYPLHISWDQFNPECRSLANNWPMHGQVDEEDPEPAGFAAAVARSVGQGRIVHICTDIFAQYRVLGDPQMLRWLREIVDGLQPDPPLATDAPSWVDVSLRCKRDRLLVHFVNGNPGRDVARLNTDDVWVDEIPAVGPITCEMRLHEAPEAVTWEPGGGALEHNWTEGVLTVVIPRLEIHGCVSVKLPPACAAP